MNEPFVEVVEPFRELVQVIEPRGPIEITEPAREVVEVVEAGQQVLYIVEPGAGRPPLRLADLADVDAASPDVGDVLTWLSGVWQPAPGGGGPGEAEPYRHEQIVPSSLWHVVHNLGYDPPACYVIDGAGVQSWPDRVRVSDNEFSLNWGSVLATGTCLTR